MPEPTWSNYSPVMPSIAAQTPLEPSRTALLVVDMQYACASRQHQLGKYYAATMPEVGDRYFDIVESTVLPNQQRLLGYFREHGLRMIYLTISSELPDGGDLLPAGRSRDTVVGGATGEKPAVWRRSFERQIMAEVASRDGELVINKLSKGAFNSSALDQILRNLRVEGLVVCGVATNACVALTAQDAADRGYRTVMVDDACASNSQILHDATLANFAHLYGRVLQTEEVIGELTAQSEAEPAAVAPAIAARSRRWTR